MSNLTDYEKLLDAIKAIPMEEIKTPNLPVAIANQEGEDLHHWCIGDRELLLKAGISAAILDELLIRCGASREAQSIWNKVRNTRQEADQDWSDKSSFAFDLRDQLVHTFKYAFRDNIKLVTLVSNISDGFGKEDMIQDLNDLSVLGKEHTEDLIVVGFDVANLDLSAKLSDEMAELLAIANGDKELDNEAKIIRDKAYTYMKQAVDEIRQCGRYVFWKNRDRRKGYYSSYKH